MITELTREHVGQVSIETLLAVQHVSTILLATLEEVTGGQGSILSEEARAALTLGQEECETIAHNVAALHELASLWWERHEVQGREV
jgi:hypothetical protein